MNGKREIEVFKFVNLASTLKLVCFFYTPSVLLSVETFHPPSRYKQKQKISQNYLNLIVLSFTRLGTLIESLSLEIETLVSLKNAYLGHFAIQGSHRDAGPCNVTMLKLTNDMRCPSGSLNIAMLV